MSLVGFRFRPSVNELISVLEIMAQYGDNVDISKLTEIPGDISGKLLYGDDDKEPWKVLCNDNEWDLYDLAVGNKKATYVITRLPKMGEKVARKAGNGTWMGQTQPVVFEKDGEEVAFMKSLSYIYTGKSSDADDKCHYYLHEYYLSKTHLEKIGAAFTDYVICRIVMDTSTSCRCRRNAKRTKRRQDDGFSCNKEDDQQTVHQPSLVYNLDEQTVNPCSFESLLMDDHNPIIHHQERFFETLNHLGLWEDRQYHGSASSSTMQQHHHQEHPQALVHQDSMAKSAIQEQSSVSGFEGGIFHDDLTNHQDYGNVNCWNMSRDEYYR